MKEAMEAVRPSSRWGALMSGGDGGGNDDGGGGGAYDLSAYDFEVEESGVSGGNGEEMALTAIFEQAEVRNTFLDDLFELQLYAVPGRASAPGGGRRRHPCHLVSSSIRRR